MTRAYALTADENGWFQQAAAGYETALLSDPADLEATVNLVVLYWQAAGGASCASGRVSAEFREHAGRRLPELLAAASQRFAGSAEVRFWQKYIAAAGSGAPLEPTECRQLLRERPDYLEPAFVVFAMSAGAEAEPEAMRLLADLLRATHHSRPLRDIDHQRSAEQTALAMALRGNGLARV
jgi:hypothetical protein